MAVACANGTISVWALQAEPQFVSRTRPGYEVHQVGWASGIHLIAHHPADDTIHVLENDGTEIKRLRELKVVQPRG